MGVLRRALARDLALDTHLISKSHAIAQLSRTAGLKGSSTARTHVAGHDGSYSDRTGIQDLLAGARDQSGVGTRLQHQLALSSSDTLPSNGRQTESCSPLGHGRKAGPHRPRPGLSPRLASRTSRVSSLYQRRSLATAAPVRSSPPAVEQPEPRRFDRGTIRDLARWEKAREREQRKIKGSEQDAVATFASREFAHVGGMQLPLSKLSEEDSGMDNSSGDVFDIQTEGSAPQVGDLVVFKHRQSGYDFAVIVRRVFMKVNLVYDMEGMCTLIDHGMDTAYRFPGFFSAAELQPIQDHLPLTPYDHSDIELNPAAVPAEVGKPVLEKLDALFKDVGEAYRKHTERISKTYDLIARDNQVRSLNLREIESVVFEGNETAPSLAESCALLCYYLFEQGPFRQIDINQAVITDSSSSDYRWLFQSRTQQAESQKVLEWARQHREVMQKGPSTNETGDESRHSTVIGQFTAWAHEVIQRSRKHRQLVETNTGLTAYRLSESTAESLPAADDSQASDGAWFEPLNDDHVLIIRWLKNWSQKLFADMDPAAVNAGPLIIQETGMHESMEYSRKTGWLFLKEIGAVLPWMRMERYQDQLQFQNPDIGGSAPPVQRTQIEGVEKDMLQDLRKDWGSLEVFAIDTAGGKLVDDAFSVESVPEEPGTHWVHMHVANPSAYLDSTHEVAREAMQQFANDYSGSQSNLMLPSWLTFNHWSLAPGRACLTFSGKVNSEGKLTDTNITPGIIRNLVCLEPEQVRAALYPDVPASEPAFTYSVGQEDRKVAEPMIASTQSQSILSDGQRERLAMLSKVTAALRPRLMDIGVIMPRWSNARSTFYSRARQPSERKFYHPKSDPSIAFHATSLQRNITEAQVEADNALMITKSLTSLASEIASQFCHKRNIPGMYYVSRMNIIFQQNRALAEEAWKHVSPTRPALRTVAWFLTQHAKPRMVTMPGVDEYAAMAVTSPLRRASDLMSHWQIQQALLLEAGAGGPIVFEENDPRLPFTHDHVKSVLPAFTAANHLRANRGKAVRGNWYKQLLLRAGESTEYSPVPKEFETLIVRPYEFGVQPRGWASQLDSMVKLAENEASEAAGGMKPGDWWLTKLKPIDFGTARIEMEPIRKLGVEGRDSYIPVEEEA